jgi:hypothetical protein
MKPRCSWLLVPELASPSKLASRTGDSAACLLVAAAVSSRTSKLASSPAPPVSRSSDFGFLSQMGRHSDPHNRQPWYPRHQVSGEAGYWCFHCGEFLQDPAVMWSGGDGHTIYLHGPCAEDLMLRILRDALELKYQGKPCWNQLP